MVNPKQVLIDLLKSYWASTAASYSDAPQTVEAILGGIHSAPLDLSADARFPQISITQMITHTPWATGFPTPYTASHTLTVSCAVRGVENELQKYGMFEVVREIIRAQGKDVQSVDAFTLGRSYDADRMTPPPPTLVFVTLIGARYLI